MSTSLYLACIEACNACADACDQCAMACLEDPQPKLMARCIALDIDCAQACRMASAFQARGSEADRAICALCAILCIRCADECDKHQVDHCRSCAEACRHCANECTRVSERRVLREEGATGTHSHRHH